MKIAKTKEFVNEIPRAKPAIPKRRLNRGRISRTRGPIHPPVELLVLLVRDKGRKVTRRC